LQLALEAHELAMQTRDLLTQRGDLSPETRCLLVKRFQLAPTGPFLRRELVEHALERA